MYNNAAGERMAAYLRGIHRGAFADFTLDELTDFEYRVMNYRERSFDQIPYSGFSDDYVARETKRAMDGAAGLQVRILPGVDIDVTTALDHSRSGPDPRYPRWHRWLVDPAELARGQDLHRHWLRWGTRRCHRCDRQPDRDRPEQGRLPVRWSGRHQRSHQLYSELPGR